MTTFRTEVNVIKKADWNHSHLFLFEGSCFAENIRAAMQKMGFNCEGGHHGILFHPIAIGQSINEVLSGKKYVDSDLFLSGKNWVSLAHHGAFSGEKKEAVLDRINQQISDAYKQMEQANVLIVTFGTAWAWQHKASNTVVGNCHRLPQQDFVRHLSSVPEMTMHWMVVLGRLFELNKNLKVVFTVSPVRHTREGMEQNGLSKALLRALCAELVNAFPDQASYFPSFEIMMDDLRDYRFYEMDMIHPSELAIDYIKNKWATAYLGDEARKRASEIEQLQKFADHRPSESSKEEHEKKWAEAHSKIASLKIY